MLLLLPLTPVRGRRGVCGFLPLLEKMNSGRMY